MRPISFKRHRFPPEIIRHTIWLYARFTLSFRDVDELLAERGIDASYDYGPAVVPEVRAVDRGEYPPFATATERSLHLDEMVIRSAAVNTGSGVRSTTRVRYSISSSSADGMHKPQRNSW